MTVMYECDRCGTFTEPEHLEIIKSAIGDYFGSEVDEAVCPNCHCADLYKVEIEEETQYGYAV